MALPTPNPKWLTWKTAIFMSYGTLASLSDGWRVVWNSICSLLNDGLGHRCHHVVRARESRVTGDINQVTLWLWSTQNPPVQHTHAHISIQVYIYITHTSICAKYSYYFDWNPPPFPLPPSLPSRWECVPQVKDVCEASGGRRRMLGTQENIPT